MPTGMPSFEAFAVSLTEPPASRPKKYIMSIDKVYYYESSLPTVIFIDDESGEKYVAHADRHCREPGLPRLGCGRGCDSSQRFLRSDTGAVRASRQGLRPEVRCRYRQDRRGEDVEWRLRLPGARGQRRLAGRRGHPRARL